MGKEYQPLIAVGMIVKGTEDEAPHLAKCLASISGHVDAIFVNLNHKKGESISPKVRSIAEQYGAKIYVTEWNNNFVNARNFIFNKIPKKYDWLMWLDSDDTVANPEKIRDIIAIASQKIQGIFIQYDYAHDEYGNCTVTHWVTRLARNNGSFAWKSSFDDEDVSVHETLVETRTVAKARNEEFKIIHHADSMRRVHSLQRNIQLLEGMYERQAAKKKLDPRVMYYLATHYFDAGNLAEAERLLLDYLQCSGWAEERSEAWVYLGLVFCTRDRLDAARQSFLRAIGENPANPRPYVELGELEFRDKRYLVSEEWLLTAIEKEQPQTTTVLLPMENKYRAYILLAQTYINMGFSKLKSAYEYVNKALELRPTDPDAKEAQKLIEELMGVRNTTKAVLRLIKVFEKNNEREKVIQLLDMLPADLQDNPLVVNSRINFAEPKQWPKKSIAIFCGNSSEGIWGPWQLEEGGMGGSEEAVVQLSNRLTELGWDVTVFATPGDKAGDYLPNQRLGDEKLIGGVHWKQYWEFNPRDSFDVLIAWRMPWFFDEKVKARKKYLWLHDVMEKNEFTKERLAEIDKVIFVSQYHAELYKGVIDEKKWFVSGNGIDTQLFAKYDKKLKRNTYRCVYMSAHERGLELLYDIWPDVKNAVPQATLDVYYGWKTYDAILKDNPERMAWKEKMVRRAKELEGVVDHGRIGHDQVAQEIQKAGILAYPCTFPEVYCITLAKSQAGGAIPVTSDFAVLKDFNTGGLQVALTDDIEKFKEDYKSALVHMLKTNGKKGWPETLRERMMQDARKRFNWRTVAEGWNGEMQ